MAIEAHALNALLTAARQRIQLHMVSPNTIEGYASDWRLFTAWCKRMDLSALPASPNTVALYVTYLLETGLKINTAQRRCSAITHYHRRAKHPSPCTEELNQLFRLAAREKRQEPKQKYALTVENLKAMAQKIDPRGRGLRDRALLLFGFATSLRRANIVALDFEDLNFVADGVLVRVRKAKEDQEGRGRTVGVPFGLHPETCPVRALNAWLGFRGRGPGALFCSFRKTMPYLKHRLPAARLAIVIQEAAASIGLDPRCYGGHSLRAGFVTEAGLHGASEYQIMQQTGHKSAQTVRKYFRNRNVFRKNAARLLDL